jgi:peptide/nickel transport system permease protein
MVKFILKRMLYGVLVVLGVLVVVFMLFQALPGDPISVSQGNHPDPIVREAIARDFGLDKPKSQQLLLYLKDISVISVEKDSPEEQMKYHYLKLIPFGESALVLKGPYLRQSFQLRRPVSEILLESLEGTIVLALTSMLFATVFGVTFGVIAALRQNSFWDRFLITISVFGISAPSFVAALLISQGFSGLLGLPAMGSLRSMDYVTGAEGLALQNLILPTLALGIRPLAIITQLTRSSMLDVLSQDYIRTAKAKGLRFYKVVINHALKNALNPVVTAISGWLASLLGGAFFIEYIFSWKGLGKVTIDAVGNLDLPVIMGSIFFVAVIFVIVNIIVDILYAVIDPRVRLD